MREAVAGQGPGDRSRLEAVKSTPSGHRQAAVRPTAGVVVFPGTNCEMDVCWALQLAGAEPELVFHDHEPDIDFDLFVVPGGFAHGDYLRPGALARFSPVTRVLRRAATAGKPVVGICNGFQVLCEAGMLPGALQKNKGLTFLCRPVDLIVEATDTPLTMLLEPGQILRGIPINHFEGNFTLDPADLAELERSRQVVLRYCGPNGEGDERFNPNGSQGRIAAVCSKNRNVVGLMPHPERAAEKILGSEDGLLLLRSVVEFARRRSSVTAESTVIESI
jgi:phosphoribosylformylglycinamidine synthase I